MTVVINEFEVVADTQASQHKNVSDKTTEPPTQTVIEPYAIAPALRALESRTLRAWAH